MMYPRSVRLAFALTLLAATAHAEPRTLRIATIVPDGTAWAREGRAFARDVETLSHGKVRIKWYLGAIAGDEEEVRGRIAREQLDGAALSMACYRLAPTMRVVRVLGLFQSRDEVAYVMGRLRPTVDSEFAKNGFANLFEAGVGSDMIFTRSAVRSLADLKATKVWVWDLDDTLRMQLDALGLPTLPTPIYKAAHEYDEHHSDGFIAVATAGLAFQWSAQARYMTDMRMAFVEGCLVVANRAFDGLDAESQQALRTAGAKLQARFEDLGRTQDDALLNGLFARQGLRAVPLSPESRSEFFSAAAEVREKLGERLIPKDLLQKVQSLLADYRAQHSAENSR
jgi:TRAP-type C4-dicarboxylate transport system substrate-binding protein